jgi:hypothetical protein
LARHLLNQSRMSSVGEIGTLHRVLVSDKSIAKSFPVLSASDMHTGPNLFPEFEVGDFRHRWQAILGNLRACEEISCKDTTQKNEEAAVPASAQPAGLRGNRDPLANRATESSSQSAQVSELAGACRRNPLSALPSGRLSLSSGVNRPAPNIPPHDSILRSQNSFGGNHRSVKTETTANSFTTISATNLEFPLTPAIQLSLSDAVKQPTLTPSAVKFRDLIATPTCKQSEDRGTGPASSSSNAPELGTPILGSTLSRERDNDMLSEISSPAPASGVASDEPGVADRPVSLKSAAIAADASSTLSPQSFHGNPDEQTASPSVSAPRNFDTATRLGDIDSEQVTDSEASAVHALKAQNSRHDRASIRETHSKLDTGTSARHPAANATGTEAPADARAGQFTPLSSAGMAQVPVDRLAPSVDPHPVLVREPFTAVDAGAEDIAPKWILASGHHAEAGFLDSSLGWVSVHAQSSAGSIHAAVIPSTSDATEVLGSHLAGLNAHMASLYEHLNPVTLSAPDAGWTSGGTRQQMAQENGGGASDSGRQQQMQEDAEPARVAAVVHSSRVLAEEPKSFEEHQTFTADRDSRNEHVSFVV